MTAILKRWGRGVGAAAGVVAGIVVALALLAGLDEQGRVALGILVWAVVWWVCSVLPEYVTALLMAVALVVVGGIESEVVFSAFAGSAWWTLLAAFALGVALRESGLLARIAHCVVRLFPPRLGAQVMALMAAGTLIGPFVPSMSAKAAMLAPLAGQIGDRLGYRSQSKGMTGLFLAVLVGVRNVGPAVISASVIGFALVGLYPADIQQRFTMLDWFCAALPWFVTVSVLSYGSLVVLYGRGAKTAACGEVTARASARSRGPLSRDEKRMAVIVCATFALWAAEPVHGVSAALVGVVGLCACAACGLIGREQFRSAITWDTLVFTGVVLGLSEVFRAVGIDTWLVGVVGPALQGLAGSPLLFVLGVAVVTTLSRFVIVSELAYINVFMAFAVPMVLGLGINPWVVGFAAYATVNPWFTLYQNPVYLAARFSVDATLTRHADCALFCGAYTLACLVGLAVSVPYWEALGLYWLA